MKQVTVGRKELLSIVKRNKKDYLEAYQEAVNGYWLEAEAKLKKFQSMIESREKLSTWRLDYPTDYSEDFDSALRMLELSADETITLDRQEFDALVMNKWLWRDQFINVCSSYEVSPKAALSKFVK